MSADNFSVRWTKTPTFTAGTYKFALGTDDGGRLYIDGVLQGPPIDQWVVQNYPTPQPSITKTLTAGAHVIVVEYFAGTGTAQATLVIAPVSPPTTPTLTFSAFTNTYWSGAGSTVVFYRPGATGSFTTTASATDAAYGIASYAFPALGAAPWTSTPGTLGVNTYSWSGTPVAPGTKNVTATNNAGVISANSPFTPTADSIAPTAGTVTYVNGTQSATSVSVSFTTGTDAGSGIGTRLLQRQSATLTGVTCGAYGAFTTVTNGTNPTSPVVDTVALGNCYKYQYVVSDNVGNSNTAVGASVVKVRTSYYDTVNGTANLLSYWRLGEPSASTIVDNEGVNTGTYFNTPTLGVTGALTGSGDNDTAVRFDGVNDYGRVARQISGDFSIEFWFKSTAGGIGTGLQWWEGAGLVDAEVGGGLNDFGVSLRSDGRVVAGVGAGSDVSIVSTPATSYKDGSWHHVVFTRNMASGALRLYIDGAAAGNATGGTTALNGPSFINFGRIQSGGNYFAGSLDEIAIYTTVLTPATVTAHFNAA